MAGAGNLIAIGAAAAGGYAIGRMAKGSPPKTHAAVMASLHGSVGAQSFPLMPHFLGTASSHDSVYSFWVLKAVRGPSEEDHTPAMLAEVLTNPNGSVEFRVNQIHFFPVQSLVVAGVDYTAELLKAERLILQLGTPSMAARVARAW